MNGLELIGKQIDDFHVHELTEIISLNYYIDELSRYNDSNLDVGFICVRPKLGRRYRISVRFLNVSDLNLIGIGNVICLGGFEIVDQKERGLDPAFRYFINDYEEGRMKFYCQSIEVVSVEELSPQK